jgi:hypothetical protein
MAKPGKRGRNTAGRWRVVGTTPSSMRVTAAHIFHDQRSGGFELGSSFSRRRAGRLAGVWYEHGHEGEDRLKAAQVVINYRTGTTAHHAVRRVDDRHVGALKLAAEMGIEPASSSTH